MRDYFERWEDCREEFPFFARLFVSILLNFLPIVLFSSLESASEEDINVKFVSNFILFAVLGNVVASVFLPTISAFFPDRKDPNEQKVEAEAPKMDQLDDIFKDLKEVGPYDASTLHQRCELTSDETIKKSLADAAAMMDHVEAVERNFPDMKPKAERLHTRYLPLLVSNLDDYLNMEKVASAPIQLAKTKHRLVETTGLVTEAMKTLISSTVQGYGDVMQADMKALVTVLHKDGLIDDSRMKMIPDDTPSQDVDGKDSSAAV